MLELSSIKFGADTSALKEAIGTMNQVKAAISSLEQAQEKAATQSSKASKAASDAAKAEAQAALAAIKLEKEKQKAVEASADATVSAGNRSISVLEKQEQVLQFMVQGYSRGQSSILATAKAAGAATDELEKLGRVVKEQRTLTGSDPFDKSTSGLSRLNSLLKVAQDRVGEYSSSLGIAAKQADDFYRDKLRLTAQFEKEGRSTQQLDVALAGLASEYKTVGAEIARLDNQYKQQQKTASDAAKANTYLETELQKVRFAVDEQNASLNRGSANALVRFENALKKSGKTAAEQKVLLDEYRQSVEKLQTAGAGRATDYISRAVGPQLTDIIVGLSTGQSLMTVMMQQGGQLRDQFAMMGVAGAEMGQVMRTALSSMAVSVKDTAKAFGQLFVGGVMDAGKAAMTFVGNITGLNTALDLSKRYFAAMGEEGFKYIGMMQKIGAVMSAVTGGVLLAGIGGIVALGVALKQVVQEEDNLAKQLALTGGSLALTHSAAIEYAQSLSDVAGSTSKAMDVIAAMAKQGGFAATEIAVVTKAATEMFKYGGIAIEDTVKAFAKMKEKPVEALIELAKQTGLVTVETIAVVNQLLEQGRTAEATAVAIKTLGDVNSQQAKRMKEDYSDFANFIIDWSSSISNAVSGVFRDIWRKASPQQQLKDQISAIDDMLEGRASLAGWLATATKSQRDSLALQKQELQNQLALMGVEEELASAKQRNAVQQASNFEKVNILMKGIDQTIEKANNKTLTQTEYIKKYVAEKTKGLEVDKQQLSLIEKAAAIEWQSMQKKGSSKEENYYQSLLRSVTNEAIGAEAAQDKLTKAYTKMLEIAADPRFLKLSEDEKARVMNKLNEAHNTQLANAAKNEELEIEELRNKILGKAAGLGKEYYATLEKINGYVKEGKMGAPEAERLTEALYKATPAYKENIKAVEELNNKIAKYKETAISINEQIAQESSSLDLRVALMGQTEESQKQITREYNAQAKLAKVNADLEKRRRDIAKEFADNPVKRWELEVEAEDQAAEQRKLINREIAVQYGEDLQAQFNEIRDGISGSVVEALFNGGKAGSQKLRSFLVEQLKKPVTLVVNAVVNTLLGSVIGGLLGGSGASGGGIVGSIGSSLLGQGATSLGMNAIGGLGSGFMSGFGETLAGSSFVGPSAAAAGGATGFGATLGQFAPWIAGAVALFSIIKSLDDSGTYHTGGAAQYSAAKGLTSGSSGAAYNFGFGQVETGASTITAMETLSKGLVNIFDGIAKTFGKTAGYEVATAFADDTSKDGAWGALAVRLQGQNVMNWNDFRQSKWAPKEFGDGEEGYKQYLSAIAKDTRQVLLDMDLPSWADKILNDLGDTPSMESLTTAVQQIGVIKSAYDTLVKQVINFANITDDSFGKLIEQFGDINTLVSQMSTYYDKYYTDTEKYNILQKDVAKGFQDIGVKMPTSREEFRKLAEAQDLNIEAGRKAYAQIIALAGSFDLLASREEELERQRKEIDDQRQDITERILKAEADLLEAQGKSEEAARKRRQLLDAQRARENAALMAVSPELAKLTYELWLLEDALSAWEAKVKTAEDAYSALDKAVSAQKDALDAQKETVTKVVDNLKQIFDLIAQNVKELYYQVDSTSGMLASQGRGVISNAIATGVLPDYNTLGEAITAVRNDIDTTQYKTQFDQDKARLQLAADLSLLQGTTERELTTAQKTLNELTAQTNYLDDLLKQASKQLDAALGIKDATLSVADAVNNLNTAITGLLGGNTSGTSGGTSPKPSGSGSGSGGAVFGPGGAPQNPVTSKYNQVTSLGTAGTAYVPITDPVYIAHLDSLAGIYNSYNGTGNLAGLLTDIKNAGGSLDDLSALSGYFSSDWRAAAEAIGIKPFANGGAFSNGIVSSPTFFNMGLMGEENPEAIMPLANVGGSLGVRAIPADNSDMQERMQNLSIEMQAVVVNTSKVARILERVTRDGEALLTKPAT